jgi:hypothetical protein
MRAEKKKSRNGNEILKLQQFYAESMEGEKRNSIIPSHHIMIDIHVDAI